MKPETPTNETEHARETVIESLKSQQSKWVDEIGACPCCVAYEYELADYSESRAEETK